MPVFRKRRAEEMTDGEIRTELSSARVTPERRSELQAEKKDRDSKRPTIHNRFPDSYLNTGSKPPHSNT